MGRGRQSEIVELSWAQPVTGTAGGWQSLGGTTPGGAVGGRAQAHPQGAHGACSRGDRQRKVVSHLFALLQELVRGRSAPTWEWSAARANSIASRSCW